MLFAISRSASPMHIDMHDAFKMREHRHARLMLHARDEALAAARHDHVDIAVETREHRAHGGAVAPSGQARSPLPASPAAFEPRDETGVNGGRRAQALGAAAQDRGVAGLETQRAGVGGDIGPAFVDHADDAERRRRRARCAARWGDRTLARTRPTGIRQIGDLLDAARHRLDAGGSSVSRSSAAGDAPVARAASTSSALAASIALRWRGEFRAPPRARRRP